VLEVRYTYEPSLARRATMRWMWLKSAGYHVGFAILGVGSILASVLGSTPWLAGCGVGATLAWIVFSLGAIRSAGTAARSREIVVQLDDDRLSVRTEIGDWSSPWRGWRLHRFYDCWLLVSPTRTVVLPLPLEAIGPQVRSFIECRVGGEPPSGERP
jgi:hypothetical protein